MRTRKEIEKDARHSPVYNDNELILEVLLDIRDLLERERIVFDDHNGKSYTIRLGH